MMSYEERSRKLGLPALVYRIRRGDMMEVYKLVNGINNIIAESNIYVWNNRNNLRENSLKSFHTKRKHVYPHQALTTWKKLTEDVLC